MTNAERIADIKETHLGITGRHKAGRCNKCYLLDRIDKLERVAEAASIALGSARPWGTDKEAIDSQIAIGKALAALEDNGNDR